MSKRKNQTKAQKLSGEDFDKAMRMLKEARSKRPWPDDKSLKAAKPEISRYVLVPFGRDKISKEEAFKRWNKVIAKYNPSKERPVEEYKTPDAEAQGEVGDAFLESDSEAVETTDEKEPGQLDRADALAPQPRETVSLHDQDPIGKQAESLGAKSGSDLGTSSEPTRGESPTDANGGAGAAVLRPGGKRAAKERAPALDDGSDSDQSAGERSVTEDRIHVSVDPLQDDSAEQADVEPPPEKKVPVWRYLEPEDQDTDPTEHFVFSHTVFEGAKTGWSIVGASVRGKSHSHTGKWGDDAFAYGEQNDWAIMVVSDGAGSATRSRVGSRVACDAAVKELTQLLDGFALSTALGKNGKEEVVPADLLRLRGFLVLAAYAARTAVFRAAQERDLRPKDLNATFLMSVVGRTGVGDVLAALQVGDGAIAILSEEEGEKCTVIGEADHGEHGGETRFITTPHVEHEFTSRVKFAIKKGMWCVAAMSDGVADDFFPETKRLGELFWAEEIEGFTTPGDAPVPVSGILRNSVLSEPRGGEALCEWLKYDRFQSFDDRTLVVLFQKAAL